MRPFETIVILTLMLWGCAPPAPEIDVNAINTSAVRTVLAQFTQTVAARPTSTSTAMPTMYPTATESPAQTYIGEQGFCIASIGAVSGNPKDVAGCGIQSRKQVQIPADSVWEVSMRNFTGSVEVFCSLYALDGTYIMTALDTTGSGKARCSPYLR